MEEAEDGVVRSDAAAAALPFAGASSVCGSDEDLIDVQGLLGDVDDEHWLTSERGGRTGNDDLEVSLTADGLMGYFSQVVTPPVRDPRKKASLVERLDQISRGTTVANYHHQLLASSPSIRSNLSPAVSSYLSRQNISSTPLSGSAQSSGSASKFSSPLFDPKTFTRPNRSRLSDAGVRLSGNGGIISGGRSHSPFTLNAPDDDDDDACNLSDLTLEDLHSSTPPNLSVLAPAIVKRHPYLNSTLDNKLQTTGGSPMLNLTFDKSRQLRNTTFDKLNATYRLDESNPTVSPVKLNSTYQVDEDEQNETSSIVKRHLHLNSTLVNKLQTTGCSPVLNLAFDKSRQLRNTTFDKLNATYRLDESNPTVSPLQLNSTHQVNNDESSPHQQNESSDGTPSRTFEVKGSSVNVRSPAVAAADNLSNLRRFSRGSSQDQLEDDRLSNVSDSSASHRLNDVGDVQQMARMQEESLRQMTAIYRRSSTMSPSSEHSFHSPSTEGYGTGNNGHECISENGSDNFNPASNQNQQKSARANCQYSSQDSLPDSPYSSQSLDSQAAQGSDRLRRSMPNLNRIRGRGLAAGLRPGLPHEKQRDAQVAMGGQRVGYGLGHHFDSDSRLAAPISDAGACGGALQPNMSAAAARLSRGSAAPARHNNPSAMGNAMGAAPTSGLRPPSSVRLGSKLSCGSGVSRIARPITATGIPRPGGGVSRLPAPMGGFGRSSSSAVPRSSSQPGSRASSVGPRRASNASSIPYYQ